MEPGRTLSHYRLIEKIGEGGMGVVWKAEDTVLGRTVAVKVLPADVSRDESRRSMFLDEARLASQVSNAHIVQVHEFSREGDLDFIVMEHVEGKPLSQILHGRPLPPDKVAAIGLQVAKALSSTHRKGLLHRDLKPSNILVTPEGDVKVADFGLATLFERRDSTPGSSDRTVSITGQSLAGAPPTRLVGTIHYMSPEQAVGEDLDARSDIFSLGVVLYEMTAGRRPFLGATTAEVLQEVANARVKPLHEMVPKVPLDLDRLVQKALARRRSDRYQTMDDLAVDLKRLSRELDSGSSPSYEDLKTLPSRVGWQRAAWITAAVATTLVALVLVGVRSGFLQGTSVSDRTILVLPVSVRGQDAGADFAGLAFAQALAINLAQAPQLKLLPVPEEPVAESERSALARRLGAGRLLTGMLVREPRGLQATLSLIDTRGGQLIWGTQSRIGLNDLSAVALALSRETMTAIGGRRPRLYEYIEDLVPEGEIAKSADLAETLGAMRRSDYNAADEATRRLVAAFPSNADAWALRLYTNGSVWWELPTRERRAEIETSLERLRELDPGNPYLIVERGSLAAYEGNPREAIAAFTSVLSRNDLTPGCRAWVLGLRADRETNLLEFAAAERDLREALDLTPAGAGPRRRLSRLYRTTKRHDEAIALANQAVALDSAYFENFTVLGLALDAAERWPEATQAFSRAVELNRSQFSLSLLAGSLFRENRREESLKIAREAESFPTDPYGCFNLACTYALAGDPAKALDLLRRALTVGFANAAALEDPALATLRDDPEFKAFVAEVQRRSNSR